MVPGRRRPSRGVELALRLEDLKDEASDARAVAGQRLLRAYLVTLLAPVSYLAEAGASWRQGWSLTNTLLLGASIGVAGAVWVWWWLAATGVAELAAVVLTFEHIVCARRGGAAQLEGPRRCRGAPAAPRLLYYGRRNTQRGS